ncbi:MAG: NADH-quinone oxidoreductase subunit D, partial [Planctomycetes bacterium]|nr:NADH-quinone oxidoreductase subunit D [Planctomycetota bacterium]
MTTTAIEFKPDIHFDLRQEDFADLRTEEMLINMGPQHPATHGVLRVVLRTDGEIVLEATPYIGYLHRCAEKIGENLATYQFIPKTDRMDYCAAMNNNHAWSLAVEKLSGLDVPERGRYIRVVAAELSRIASHLIAFGTYGLDMGAFTPFLYAFREREYILDLFEAMCGARLTCSYIYPGGPWYPNAPNEDPFPEAIAQRTREFLDYFEPKIDEYNQLLSFNQIFIRRTAGVGVISAERAIAYGLSGPVLRASGPRWDLRRVTPYDLYDRFEFEIPVGVSAGDPGEPFGLKGRIPEPIVLGDSWNRYFVRMLEMKQSVRILRQCIAQMPREGEVKAKVPKNLKLNGEVY